MSDRGLLCTVVVGLVTSLPVCAATAAAGDAAVQPHVLSPTVPAVWLALLPHVQAVQQATH